MPSGFDKAAFHDLVRFLPHAATVGMVIVLVLQIAGRLGPGAGFFDFLILGGIWVASRRIVRAWDLEPPKR